MTVSDFVLDPRLAADTSSVLSLPLCEVLLMKDARYPWLVLVPRHNGLVEVTDLDVAKQAQLWREVSKTSEALRSVAPCEKLNIGALGNIVRQLHIHVVSRSSGDEAWPGPVWGQGTPLPYATNAMLDFARSLKKALAV